MATATLKSDYGNAVYDGKKKLTVSDYSRSNGKLDLNTLAAKDFLADTKIDGVATVVSADSVKGAFDPTKITEVDASKASGLNIVVQSAKATTVTLNGGTVTGGTGADKFIGSSSAEVFVSGGGNDVIGDGKTASTGFDKEDVIVLPTGTKAADLTFTDAIKSGILTTTITNASNKAKTTVNRSSINDSPLTIKVGSTVITTYGTSTDSNTELSSDGKTLKISGDGLKNASTLAAGVKIIDATGASSGSTIIGNGQSDVISVAGGVIVNGGYDASKNKATSDNIYAPTGSGDREAITFVFDAGTAGADNIYNYDASKGDVISLTGASPLDLADAKVVKDGGAGKDLTITESSGRKVTVKLNDSPYVNIIAGSKLQRYGVDLGTNVSVNAKKTALVIGADAAINTGGAQDVNIGGKSGKVSMGASDQEDATSVSLTGWMNMDDKNALLTYAPKINEIDASAATTNLVLNAITSVNSVLRGGTAKTTLVGGKGNDQMYGGSGSDVFVVNSSSAAAEKGGAPGKDNIDEYGAGDFIMVKNIGNTDNIALSSKGVLTFSDDKTDQKNNTVTIKNFKKLGSTPVVVLSGTEDDGKYEILAVNSNSGVPAPIGMDATAKAGITTNSEFTGAYAEGTYVKGASVNLSEGTVDLTSVVTEGSAIIDANDYGGAAKAVIASVVGSGLNHLVIKGNAAAKNTIYTPVRTAEAEGEAINVTVHGGTANDTFIGNSTATKTKVTYVFDGSGKDIIQGYNEGDEIILPYGSTKLAGVKNDSVVYSNDSRITEKGSDVTYTDGKNSLTIKNGAGKALTFRFLAKADGSSVDGTTYYYGHTLPAGLEYDTKQTAINANSSLLAEAATLENSPYTEEIQVGDDDETKKLINIDLTKTTVTLEGSSNSRTKAPQYYTTIKTVSLAGASETFVANVSGNTLANELYAGLGGATLYGGDPGTKADADKLYGNTGADTFVYKYGGGADVIGNTKTTATLLDESDTVVLRSNTKNVLTRDEVTITDKGKVITVQYNGSDAAAKASKLTINKKSEATPINIILDDSSTGLAKSSETFVYGISDEKFRADAAAFAKNNLIISDTAGKAAEDGWQRSVTDEDKEALGATNEKGADVKQHKVDVDVKDISSSLKNIQVTAASDVAVSIVGGLSALNVTLGAGGGTVKGGHQVQTNGKIKTFNDKFYADANATIGSTFVLEDETGGKDNVYNYDATRGDTLIFKVDSKIPTVSGGAANPSVANIKSYLENLSVKFGAKSIAFAYKNGTKSSLTLNSTGSPFAFDTNIKIGFTDGTTTTQAQTYYGWDSKTTNLADYLYETVSGDWTSPSDNVFVYTGSGETNYNKKWIIRGNVQDANGDYVPDGIMLSTGDDKFSITGFEHSQTDKIAATTVNKSAVYVDERVDNFHIGFFEEQTSADDETKTVLTTLTAFQPGAELSANGIKYKLYDVDFDSDNGLELTYNNFVKLSNDGDVAYFSEDKLTSERTKDENTYGLGADFTLKSTIADTHESTSKSGKTTVAAGYLSKFSVERGASGGADTINIAAASTTNLTNAHIILNPGTEADPLGANKYADYVISVSTLKSGNVVGTNTATYKLYDGDGNTVNGYELLRTDISSAKNWKLITGKQAEEDDDIEIVQNQSNGTGYWTYDSGTTSAQTALKIGFSIDSDAGIKASADGLPVGISIDTVKSGTKPAGTVITFDDSKFNTKYFHFDAATSFGKESLTSAHVAGLAVGTTFTVAGSSEGEKDTVYALADLDGVTENGLELLKVEANSGWTYNAGAWTFDNTKIPEVNPEDESSGWNSNTAPAVVFTISAQASIKASADGTPEGITVDYDASTGKVSKIDLSPLTQKANRPDKKDNTTDTSLVTFASLPTGDIDNTVHIVGFTGYDSKAKKVTTVNVGSTQYYLAALQTDKKDSNTGTNKLDTVEGLELLAVNKNWLLQNGQWEYYKNGVPTAIEVTGKRNPDLTINTVTSGGFDLPGAAIDGSPRGIAISGDNITLKPDLGVIDSDVSTAVARDDDGNVADAAASVQGSISAGMITFASTTGVNKSSIHILPLTSKVGEDGEDGKFVTLSGEVETVDDSKLIFDPDATVTFDIATATNKSVSTQFVFADLDRDSSNGYELLPTNDKGWKYNSGEITTESDEAPYVYTYKDSDTSSALGSWTYSTSVKLGNAAEAANFTFDILPAANLYAKSVIDGTPENVTVDAKDTGVTIKANGIALTNFAFDSVVASKAFISDTGVHFIGFSENDTLAVHTGTDTENDDAPKYTYYRLKDLDGSSATGLEMLKIEDRDRWTLTTTIDKSKKTQRAWTYNGASDTDTGFVLSISSDASLEAVAGKPQGVIITKDPTEADSEDRGYATISFDDDQFKVSNSYNKMASTVTLTTSNVGSGTSIHIVGFDTDTTLKVGSDAYRVTDLDGISNGKELLKVDANWRYYGEAVTKNSKTEHGAKTWTYTYESLQGSSSKGTFSFELGAQAGKNEPEDTTGRNVAADANGKPIGITVEGGKLNPMITIDTDTLNVVSDSNSAKSLQHITFNTGTAVGASGIHIKGIDSDATVSIYKDSSATDATTYYLVDLDGNTSNGYELAETTAEWKRTSSGWTYTQTTAEGNELGLKFHIDKSVAESGGTPSGVTVAGSTITFATTTKVAASDLRFEVYTPGAENNGLHIKGLKLNDSIYVPSLEGNELAKDDNENIIYEARYKLKELDYNSENGLELLANNANWTLTNAAVNGSDKGNRNRIWAFESDTIKFTVNTGTAIASGLSVADPSTGIPTGVSVTADGEGDEKTYSIAFGAVTTGGALPTVDMLKIDKMPVGMSGVHIASSTVVTTADTNDGTKYLAYGTDTGTMFTVGSNKYYLADIDGNTENGYELLKYDTKWHRTAAGWTYTDASNKIQFTINNPTSGEAQLLASDTGVPANVVVSGTKITIKSSDDNDDQATALKNLIFQDGTNMSAIHIYVEGDDGYVTEASGLATSTVLYSDTTAENAANATSTYYFAHTDGTANDWELVKKDSYWTRQENGWHYKDTDNNSGIEFFISSTKAPVKSSDTGVPLGITVDTSTKTISFDNTSKLTASDISANLFLIGGKSLADSIGIDETDKTKYHIKGIVGEGANIKVLSAYADDIASTTEPVATYQLYNADGKVGTTGENADNGLELTKGGWLDTSVTISNSEVKAYRYQTGTNTNTTANTGFIVYGNALGTTTSTAKLTWDGDTSKWRVEGIDGVSNGVITLSPDIDDFSTSGFHVSDTGLAKSWNGATVKAALGESEKSTSSLVLKDMDTNAGDYELTNNGWAKHSNNGVFYYSNTTVVKFTLSAMQNAQPASEDTTDHQKDTNNNLIPDFVYGEKVANNGLSITLTSDQFNAPFTFTGGKPENFEVKVVDEDGKAVTVEATNSSVTPAVTKTVPQTYTFTSDTTTANKYYLVANDMNTPAAASGGEGGSAGGQLPATGYDLDDLINPTTAADADISTELDEILEIKPLAATNAFDTSELLTDIGGSDKSLASLTYAARHKDRK